MTAAEQPSPALKDIFNAERLKHIATEMTAVYPDFNARAFLKLANDGLADLSIMQRMARVSESLHAVLPLGYDCLLYTSPSPRDGLLSRMPSSA